MTKKDKDPHHSKVLLAGDNLTIEDVVAVARGRKPVRLADEAKEKVQTCREWVDKVVREERPRVYGLRL